jgi:2-hydroxy-3-keto-5-methylthiopentenyl-1-phosphate phosphatase
LIPSIKIFTDFDGTITLKDVGDSMFERFGGPRCLEFIEQYQDGLISAAECFRRESAACGEVDRNALDAFLDAQPVDTTFNAFADFCKTKNLGLTIFSDGMDYYIRRILNRMGVGDVPFYSNALHLVPVDSTSKFRFEPKFPYLSESCDRCACCKRNIMLTHSADDDILICVGEGYSDRCAVKYADLVFAKDNLAEYCSKENMPFYEYRTFNDIAARINEMIGLHEVKPSKTRLHKRRQAELARRELFIAE